MECDKYEGLPENPDKPHGWWQLRRYQKIPITPLFPKTFFFFCLWIAHFHWFPTHLVHIMTWFHSPPPIGLSRFNVYGIKGVSRVFIRYRFITGNNSLFGSICQKIELSTKYSINVDNPFNPDACLLFGDSNDESDIAGLLRLKLNGVSSNYATIVSFQPSCVRWANNAQLVLKFNNLIQP